MSVVEEKVVVDSSADESGRLNIMLDHAGFRSGRGRVAEFHSYLVDTVPDMADLPYGTARSWLSGHTPPVHKMETIVKSLQTKISNCPKQIVWCGGGKWEEPTHSLAPCLPE